MIDNAAETTMRLQSVVGIELRTALPAAVLLGCLLNAPSRAEEPTSNPATPASASSLMELEHRVQEAAKKALPSVVAIGELPPGLLESLMGRWPSGAGVIITADGLILSQRHVTHAMNPPDHLESRKPGHRVKVVFHDGRTAEAELLGANCTYDLSLLRLIEPGPYPHAPLDGKAVVTSGEMVLKLGHPRSYQPGRDPVLRCGRVLCAQEGWFASDCLITGGDSGGPYFDLDGRLVGILHRSTVPDAMRELLSPRHGAGIVCTALANALIQTQLDSMRRGEMPERDGDLQSQHSNRIRNADVLPVERWAQGAVFRAAYRDVIKQARLSVVAVCSGDEVAAFGTVVGADGWVVTKASQLPAEPMVRLADGRTLAACVTGVDPAFDVALLKIPTAGLTPIEWAATPRPVAGTFLAVPGLEELPRAVGVVSVARRDPPGPFPTRVPVLRLRRERADLPELIGSAVWGRGYWVEFVEGRAAEAGIQPGDVILTIAGKAVRRHEDLVNCVVDRWANESVVVRLLRGAKPREVTLRLDAKETSLLNFRSPIPTMFEHDAPVVATECGGPVVDLTGKALGITIARCEHGCIGMPSDCILGLLPDLKSGKLASHWATYRESLSASAGPAAPRTPTQGRPVTLTLEDLKQKLTDRRERFKSLLVEYDVLSEAHVDPRSLVQWEMFDARDFEERHCVAFAGSRQFFECQRPRITMNAAPQAEVAPDPNAPAPVAERVARRQRVGQARKEQGLSLGMAHWSTRPEQEGLIFDGASCFIHEDSGWQSCAASFFRAPVMYLAGLGLRPWDPKPVTRGMRRLQQEFWFPDNFAMYEKCRVLPNEETVDGASCLVVEAQRDDESEGTHRAISDKFWFDAKLGFTPRRWERRADGALAEWRTHTEFEESAPGCWLPWKSVWTHATPPWVSPELRGPPAYSFNMQLRKAQVNCVRDDLFRPRSGVGTTRSQRRLLNGKGYHVPKA